MQDNEALDKAGLLKDALRYSPSELLERLKLLLRKSFERGLITEGILGQLERELRRSQQLLEDLKRFNDSGKQDSVKRGRRRVSEQDIKAAE